MVAKDNFAQQSLTSRSAVTRSLPRSLQGFLPAEPVSPLPSLSVTGAASPPPSSAFSPQPTFSVVRHNMTSRNPSFFMGTPFFRKRNSLCPRRVRPQHAELTANSRFAQVAIYYRKYRRFMQQNRRGWAMRRDSALRPFQDDSNLAVDQLPNWSDFRDVLSRFTRLSTSRDGCGVWLADGARKLSPNRRLRHVTFAQGRPIDKRAHPLARCWSSFLVGMYAHAARSAYPQEPRP